MPNLPQILATVSLPPKYASNTLSLNTMLYALYGTSMSGSNACVTPHDLHLYRRTTNRL